MDWIPRGGAMGGRDMGKCEQEERVVDLLVFFAIHCISGWRIALCVCENRRIRWSGRQHLGEHTVAAVSEYDRWRWVWADWWCGERMQRAGRPTCCRCASAGGASGRGERTGGARDAWNSNLNCVAKPPMRTGRALDKDRARSGGVAMSQRGFGARYESGQLDSRSGG